MIGRRLGRFTVLAPLGQGGMGSVWRARDELSGRDVALKVLSEVLATSPEACRRFRREAEIAALLDHPSIAAVCDVGEQDGSVYLAMALVEGKTLAERLTAGLPPIAPALRTIALAAEALGYAHGRGVLHRDVSSRNIMLGDDGRVFVLDFGLALVYGRSRLSSSGARLGTIAYMSPEVMRGDEADPRSDVYGLGVTAYHYLTGNFPFTGERDEAVVYQRLNVPVTPPSMLRAEIGAELDAVLMRALAREPAERFASADEFAIELKRIAGAAESGHGRSAGSHRTTDHPSEVATRVAAGTATAYLGVLPIAASGDSEAAMQAATRIAAGLTETVMAGLAQVDRVHTVRARSESDHGGANILLRASLRAAGTALRATFALVDCATGAQISGGTADGSAIAPFELEDRLVQAVRSALGVAGVDTIRASRSPPDPAAADKFALAVGYLRRFDNDASLDGAVTLLQGLIASEGESAALQATLARALTYKYRLSRQASWEAAAARACDRAATLDPGSADVALAVGELHVAAGRHAEALTALDRVLAARADDVEARLARAAALDGRGRTREAESLCRELIAERPSDWRTHHTLALVSFRHGRYARAMGPWKRVTELLPDNASAWRNLGSTHFRMGHMEQAIEAFRTSNEIQPSAMAFYSLGTALFQEGRLDESIDAFERAVALNPSDPLAWGNLGSACRYIPGRETRMREALERGIAMMRERLDREPAGGASWARLASWYANLGRREDAAEAVRRALELARDDVEVMVAVAAAYLDLDDREAALRWLNSAVRGGHAVRSLGRRTAFRRLEGDPEFERILAQGPEAHGTRISHDVEGGQGR